MTNVTNSLSDLVIKSKNEQIRVRTIISALKHEDLVRRGIIPDLLYVTKQTSTKRYPGWIYKLKRDDVFSHYGIFMEDVVVSGILSNESTDYIKLWSKSGIKVSDSDISKSWGSYVNLANKFKLAFQGHINIQHGSELSYKSIQGHPDIMNDNWIIDVKTTQSFSKMAEESFLQILAYRALAVATGKQINYIGILLSMQQEILWYDVTGWDSSQYLQVLLQESKWCIRDQNLHNPESFVVEVNKLKSKPEKMVLAPNILGVFGFVLDNNISPLIGYHIRKHEEYPPNTPLQIYLGGNQSCKFVTKEQLDPIKDKCTPQHTVFVHAQLTINLCETKPWPVNLLRHELSSAQYVGAKGVVVHLGCRKTMTIEQGLKVMSENINKCLDRATEDCPLMLETPAGAGTILCSNLEDFIEFYKPYVNTNLKICVDTCHVFASGYDPAYYIQRWLSVYPGSIKLVHFNDSKERRGSRKDRHHPPGLGYIGFPRLWEVHEICRLEKIPMTQE